MLDWNGNGKIDPVDIGISVANQKETEKEAEKPKAEDKKSNAGCLTSVILVVGLIAVIIGFVF